MVSCEGWGEGHQFEDAGGEVQEVLWKPEEVCQGIMDASGQSDSLACDMAEGFMNLDKKASGAGNGNHYRLYLSRYLVPCVHDHLFLGGWDGVHDLLYMFNMVRV